MVHSICAQVVLYSRATSGGAMYTIGQEQDNFLSNG